jgi:hypothetical protein
MLLFLQIINKDEVGENRGPCPRVRPTQHVLWSIGERSPGAVGQMTSMPRLMSRDPSASVLRVRGRPVISHASRF